jgi:hypothetical protein
LVLFFFVLELGRFAPEVDVEMVTLLTEEVDEAALLVLGCSLVALLDTLFWTAFTFALPPLIDGVIATGEPVFSFIVFTSFVPITAVLLIVDVLAWDPSFA